MSEIPPSTPPSYGSAVRMAQIMLWLHQAPLGLTYADLRERLGVSERTLARYVRILRELFVDDSGEPMFEVARRDQRPRLQFRQKPLHVGGTAMELMGLFLALELMKFLEGTFFSEGSEQLIDRVCSALLRAQGHHVQLMLKDFHRKFFHWTEAPKTYEKHNPILQRIVEALIFQRVVGFTYQAPGKSPRHHQLHPLTLLMYKRGLYLVGKKELAKDAAELTFAVERIHDLQLTQTSFAYPAAYAPEKRFLHGFGLIQHDRPERVHLRFHPRVAANVVSRRWHPSQETKMLESGELDLFMDLEIGAELVSWIQSFGSFVRVVAPSALIERITEAARKTLDQYTASDGTTPAV